MADFGSLLVNDVGDWKRNSAGSSSGFPRRGLSRSIEYCIPRTLDDKVVYGRPLASGIRLEFSMTMNACHAGCLIKPSNIVIRLHRRLSLVMTWAGAPALNFDVA